MDKAAFIADLGALFNKDCNHNDYVSNFTFTNAERENFLTHLWERFGQSETIDFSSPPAIAAFRRVQRNFISLQDQAAAFPAYFQEEVEKAKVKK